MAEVKALDQFEHQRKIEEKKKKEAEVKNQKSSRRGTTSNLTQRKGTPVVRKKQSTQNQ